MLNADIFSILDVQLIAAGFLGGLVHAFRLEKATPWQVVGYIVVGGIAANFIAPQVLKLLTLLPAGFVAFGIGMSGKHLCFVLEKFFDRLLDTLGKARNE